MKAHISCAFFMPIKCVSCKLYTSLFLLRKTMSVKVAIAQINSIVGDIAGNAQKIKSFVARAVAQGADLVLTPECGLVGYPPEDLLLRPAFYQQVESALKQLTQDLAQYQDVAVVIGHPYEAQQHYFNGASVLLNGQVIAQYAKETLPNDSVFDEKRYFTSNTQPLSFQFKGTIFGLNICEDVWFPDAPQRAKAIGTEVLLILNGSPFHINKQQTRFDVVHKHVTALGMSAIFANLSGGQDELIFDGQSFVLNAQGQLCLQMAYAEEDLQLVEVAGTEVLTPAISVPACSVEEQVYKALVLGVKDYIGKNGFPSVLLGLSGGVDSALTLAVAVDALGKDRVRAVMMPSPYTAEISKIDSRDMVARLGVQYDELDIQPCFSAFKDTLSGVFAGLTEDVTEENIQARIRGTLLMAMSNKTRALVLTTGNKSEMAVGYCTLYGDMAGGFAVLKDIPKTLVYQLCHYRNRISAIIPERILTRAPSAELRPDQKDQDSLPEYAVLDAIVAMYMEENRSVADIIAAGYDRKDVDRVVWLLKINEYKRRQSPVGIRVTHRAFGRDWRYPITSKYQAS